MVCSMRTCRFCGIGYSSSLSTQLVSTGVCRCDFDARAGGKAGMMVRTTSSITLGLYAAVGASSFSSSSFETLNSSLGK
jgi:hypothetical protein